MTMSEEVMSPKKKKIQQNSNTLQNLEIHHGIESTKALQVRNLIS